MADMLIDLTTGRFTPKQTAGQLYGSSTGYGAMRVGFVDQERAELTRAGRRFKLGYTAAPTGIAPVATIPTTAAQWTIFNASQTDTYTFEELGVHLYSGTAAAGVVVVACFFTLPVQTGFATGIAAQSCSASQTKSSSAAVKSGVTISTPAAPAWFHVAKSDSANTGAGSVMAFNDQLKGGLMLPPLTGLGIATLSGAGTSPLYIPVATWTEGAQDLE